MPGTTLSLDLGHENVQGCPETLGGLEGPEHLLSFRRKRTLPNSFWVGPGILVKRISEVGVLAGLEPEEKLEGLVVTKNTHHNPEVRRRTLQGCSSVPRHCLLTLLGRAY